MRILFTNNTLDHRAGTELFVAELTRALLDRGHSPLAWSPRLGSVAEVMRAATVPVVASLDAIGEPPDLIHGQHHLETVQALLHFPGVPAIYVCHGWLPWEETPPRFPRILRYVAVDETVRDRLVSECAIPTERVELIFNWVDLPRFLPRSPLPDRPRRALVFSNQADGTGYVGAIREACAEQGITVDLAGVASGRVTTQPGELLADYDVVFAKGRSALEAMAVGCAVVLADAASAGPLVTPADFDRLRKLNFGVRTLDRRHSKEHYVSQLLGFNAGDATSVAHRARAEAGLEHGASRYLDLYAQVLATWNRQPADGWKDEHRAAERYIRWLSPTVKQSHVAALERSSLRLRVAQLEAEAQDLRERAERSAAEAAVLHDRTQAASLHAARAQKTLDAMHRTVTWRLRKRLLGNAAVRFLYRWLRGSTT